MLGIVVILIVVSKCVFFFGGVGYQIGELI